MVTRMLNLLGVDLGDEQQLLPPQERDNARGYWEPRWMIELNEEILAALGSGTFEPFAAEPGWERSPQLEPLRVRARELLDAHFGEREVWGWKDPRTSLTLPFWRELVGEPLRCVVCVRSPADAVASALKRGVPDVHRWTYAERWLDYTSLALASTAPDERMVVFYEDAMHDPAGEARRLAAFVGLEAPDADALTDLAELVDADLRHHRTSAWDVAVDPGLPIEARALFLQLRAARRLTAESADQASGRLREALERVGAELRDARRSMLDADGGRRVAEASLAEREDELAARAADLEQVRAHLEAVERTHAQLTAETARLREQVGQLQVDVRDKDETLTAITASRSWRMTEPLRSVRERLRNG